MIRLRRPNCETRSCSLRRLACRQVRTSLTRFPAISLRLASGEGALTRYRQPGPPQLPIRGSSCPSPQFTFCAISHDARLLSLLGCA